MLQWSVWCFSQSETGSGYIWDLWYIDEQQYNRGPLIQMSLNLTCTLNVREINHFKTQAVSTYFVKNFQWDTWAFIDLKAGHQAYGYLSKTDFLCENKLQSLIFLRTPLQYHKEPLGVPIPPVGNHRSTLPLTRLLLLLHYWTTDNTALIYVLLLATRGGRST